MRVCNAALGLASGAARLALPFRFGLPVHGWAHLRMRQERPGRAVSFMTERELEAEVRTVDEVCAEHGVERVHFMKLDVEGFESAVLEGAEEVLERDRPALMLENEDRHLDKYGTTSAEVAAALRARGYAMYAWRGRGWARVAAVTGARRNYLFATAETWLR